MKRQVNLYLSFSKFISAVHKNRRLLKNWHGAAHPRNIGGLQKEEPINNYHNGRNLKMISFENEELIDSEIGMGTR
jgi:hypothetical protein